MGEYYFRTESTVHIADKTAFDCLLMKADEKDQEYSQYSTETNLNFFEFFALGPGLAMITAKHFTEKELSIKFESRNDLVNICYCQSGTKEVHLTENRIGCGSDFSVSGGERIVAFSPRSEGVKRLIPDQYHAMATIVIHPCLLRRIVGNTSQIQNDDLKKVLQGKTNRFFEKDDTPLWAQTVTHQILNCTLEGNARQLFIKSKALELLSLQLSEMTRKDSSGYDKIRLSKKDLDAVRAAGNFLVEDICNVPTVPQLAARCGINTLKLKAGFQRIFGESIRVYLHNYRMEKARIMIEGGGVNVSEIAWQIGYTNVSHFIAAYCKAYGVTPGQYISELKKNESHGTLLRAAVTH